LGYGIIDVAGRSRFLTWQTVLSVSVPTFVGVVAIITGFRLVKTDFDGHFFIAIKRTHAFFVDHGRAAMLIGGGITSLLIAAFLYFPPQEGPAERFAAIVGIYSALLTVFIAAQLFYDRIGPITSVEGLLRSLTNDLTQCHEGTQLLVVYQLPNIGHYRYLSGISYAYPQFKRALRDAVGNSGVHARFVSIHEAQAKAYWCAYLDGKGVSGSHVHRHKSKKSYVRELTTEAKKLLEGVRVHGKHDSLPAAAFPPQVVVVGNVCYQIATYGLPMAVGDRFISATGESRLAQIVAYRRTDPDLAAAIVREVDRWVSHASGTR
jgi:hypothetical protein